MCLSTSSIHLASYVGFPPLASPQLLAFMLFQYLHPCASQQLPACIWFQYLGFPCPSTTHCAHLASISNFPPCASHQTSQTSCTHWVSISILSRGCDAPLLVTHWVSHLLPIPPSSSQFLLFTPLPAFQLQRGSTWSTSVKVWGHSSSFNI